MHIKKKKQQITCKQQTHTLIGARVVPSLRGRCQIQASSEVRSLQCPHAGARSESRA